MSKEYLYNFWLTVVAAPAATACSLARSASAAARFLHTHRQTNKRQKQQSKNEKKKKQNKTDLPSDDIVDRGKPGMSMPGGAVQRPRL
jgi:phosphoribosylpyrophosphate synthetase